MCIGCVTSHQCFFFRYSRKEWKIHFRRAKEIWKQQEQRRRWKRARVNEKLSIKHHMKTLLLSSLCSIIQLWKCYGCAMPLYSMPARVRLFAFIFLSLSRKLLGFLALYIVQFGSVWLFFFCSVVVPFDELDAQFSWCLFPTVAATHYRGHMHVESNTQFQMHTCARSMGKARQSGARKSKPKKNHTRSIIWNINNIRSSSSIEVTDIVRFPKTITCKCKT